MSIVIVGLGPGPQGMLTGQAIEALRGCQACYVQTAQHPAARQVDSLGIKFEAMDELYRSAKDFDALNEAVAQKLVDQGAGARVAFAVTGEASQGQSAVGAVLRRAGERGVKTTVIPGVGMAAAAMAAAGVCCDGGVETHYGRVEPLRADCNKAQVVCEVDSQLKAGEVKIDLMELYPETWQVALVRADEGALYPAWCALYELDRQRGFDATSCVVVPPLPFGQRTRYLYADLQEIVRILRAPDGCPWDREQTHFSLKSAMLEEACEAIAAVDEGDSEHLCEELGDVLLQAAMHAEIAQEEMVFSSIDMVSGICEKLIRRHPHVFGSVTVSGTGEVLKNWEAIKSTEKGHEPKEGLLCGVGDGLPALMRAQKLQKKAKSVGFDWEKAAPAVEKVQEESQELLQALSEGAERTEEEAGDLLFSAVNAVRLCGVHAETALMGACEKFVRRFGAMERLAGQSGGVLAGKTLAELDALWEQAKSRERQEKA